MIPTTTEKEVERHEFNFTSEIDIPTKTYFMDLNKVRVSNYTDNLPAMKQAIYKVLQTERYQYSKIYSDNYGVEFIDLYGMPISYCIIEIQRRITEAVTWDERVEKVDNFTFDTSKKGVVFVGFTAHTIFGSVNIENVEVKV